MMKPKDAFKWHRPNDTRWQTMTSVDELEKDIEQYFTLCRKEREIPTLQGLQLHVGITKNVWHRYIHKLHAKPTNEIIRVQEIFARAKLYIEVSVLHAVLDCDNKNAAWYLSKFRDFADDYNPKQAIEVNKAAELDEAEIDEELLMLEQKEKELTKGET